MSTATIGWLFVAGIAVGLALWVRHDNARQELRRLEAERAEAERLEQERLDEERRELERQNAERLAKEVVALVAAFTATVGDDYLRASVLNDWRRSSDVVDATLLTPYQRDLLDRGSDVSRAYYRASRAIEQPVVWAREWNEAYIRRETKRRSEWFDTRFSHPLTTSQRRAVVVDDDVNLVVAGAGAGKTATLLAKVAYLLEHRSVDPAEILVLAFNKSVATEVKERVGQMGLPRPEVSTFHAKGYEVLGEAEGRKPAVSALATDPTALPRFLQQTLVGLLASVKTRRHFTKWWVAFRVELEDFADCKTPDERWRRERSFGLRTLTNVEVQSIAEVKVADWLTLNGVDWEHEPRYPHSPPSQTRRDYTPDFFLPDYGVWLEVWACDSSEIQFPSFIDREQYAKGMTWKRELHATHGTTLMEVYQDEVWALDLGKILERKLRKLGIEPAPPSAEEIATLLVEARRHISPFVGLVASFLRLYRSGGWSRKAVKARAETRRDKAFLGMFWPFLDAYEAELQREGKIDFDGMLVEAAKARASDTQPSAYKYILVDEFQDTSRARLELLRSLRGLGSECRVFAVGDDWQAVYRFAGSDVAYFSDIEEHLGPTAQVKLADTFRLESDVADLSTTFVLQNTAQIEKTLTPRAASQGAPGVAIHLHMADELEVAQQVLDDMAADKSIRKVLVLARYNFRLESLDALEAPDGISLERMTVHRSKGLEADAVLVFGLDAGLFGFPSEIQDDRVLRLLLEGPEEVSNAEERRLFYVALTRTRSRVHLFANARGMSPFIQELERDEYAEWIDFYGELSDRFLCPRCQGKTIVRREGSYGTFWACSNYPRCRGRLPGCSACKDGVLRHPEPDARPKLYRCSSCSATAEQCPSCGANPLVERAGKFGEFLGCAGWRRDGSGCDYTRSMGGSARG